MTSMASQTAATAKLPRTSWGDPKIEGTYTNKDEFGTPFERPDELVGGGGELGGVDAGVGRLLRDHHRDRLRADGGAVHLPVDSARDRRALRGVRGDVDVEQALITPACGLIGVLNEATRAFLATLDKYTLEDLVRRSPRKLSNYFLKPAADAGVG